MAGADLQSTKRLRLTAYGKEQRERLCFAHPGVEEAPILFAMGQVKGETSLPKQPTHRSEAETLRVPYQQPPDEDAQAMCRQPWPQLLSIRCVLAAKAGDQLPIPLAVSQHFTALGKVSLYLTQWQTRGQFLLSGMCPRMKVLLLPLLPSLAEEKLP